MLSEGKIDLKSVILKLLEEKERITLHDIAQKTGLSSESPANRRAIQRALAKLIESNMVESHGQARARVYTKHVSAETKIGFTNVPLSKQAEKLLRYVSQPIPARKPVGYNQDFLISYQPNQSGYLSNSLRQSLFRIGNAEPRTRPSGTYAHTILNRLLIDLSWNSSRLEGNTYSLLETKRLIEFGEATEGKAATEAQMILNHKNAIEYIIEMIDEKEISAHEVRSIHALLSENLLGDSSASGRIRMISVGISGTSYVPIENPHLLKGCFDLFIEKINRIKDPFEQSFFALVHLSYLQSFEDVNKRTARLVANIPLIKQNLKPLSFIGVDKDDYVTSLLGVYEKNDTSLLCDLYDWAYQRSAQRYSALQQSMGEPNVFKLKYRDLIHHIVRTIILNNVPSARMVPTIKQLITAENLTEGESEKLFQVIETEIINLHDGNIARFKIQLSEFHRWKKNQV